MQQNLNNITFLYPSEGCDFNQMYHMTPRMPFSDEDVDLLNALSIELMHDKTIRGLPDVATFAFFCRKANIQKLKERFLISNELRLGRGMLFHIAPSNVPVNFAYSFVCGLLSGNVNVVRVPSKNFQQVDIIINAFIKVMSRPEFRQSACRTAFIRYERGDKATDLLSSMCDVRIIWGGDATIADIRRSPIAARSFDVTFADRYSIAIIDADKYLCTADAQREAENFYNDTYLFDQNACSAPHLVIWRGESDCVVKAQDKFWTALYEYASVRYKMADILAIDKLTSFYSQSLAMDVYKESSADNLIWRVKANTLPYDIDKYRCKAGFFTEYRIDQLEQISYIINRKYQTIAYYGLSEIEVRKFIKEVRPMGVDRVVPLGKTTEFSLNWDGYDMIRTLTRIIIIKE